MGRARRISMGDLEGATIGVVGYGRIGRRVADLARAFGMTVLAHDPYVTESDPELVSLEELRRRANVITLHLPLTPETHHLVDADFLAGLQPGTILVNCGRGGLLDLDAAAAALETGSSADWAWTSSRPSPEHHPVFDRDDVVLSPHLMGLSAGAIRTTFAAAAQGRLRRPVRAPARGPGERRVAPRTRLRTQTHEPTHRRHDERARPHRRSTHQLGGLRGPGLGVPAARRAGALPDERGRPGRHRARSGRLPARDPTALAATLAAHHLTAVGGFTPFVLHQAEVDPMVELDRLLPGFVATAADVMVLSADSGLAGYDSRPELDHEGWQRLLRNLDRVATRAASTASERCCTRTSAPWWRPVPTCSGCSRAPRSRCAWTPGTC